MLLTHGLRAAAGNRETPLTLTLNSITNYNAVSFTLPVSSQEGDLAILIDTPLGSSLPTLVIPSGWSSVYDFSGSATSFIRASFSYRILTSSDPGSSYTGMDGSAADRKSVMIFRPNKAITSVSGGGGVGVMTESDPASQTITSSTQSPPALAIAVGYQAPNTTISSATMTLSTTDTVARSILYSIMNTTTSNHSFDATDTGVNNMIAGCYFAAT